jgi:hypothetical protein
MIKTSMKNIIIVLIVAPTHLYGAVPSGLSSIKTVLPFKDLVNRSPFPASMRCRSIVGQQTI